MQQKYYFFVSPNEILPVKSFNLTLGSAHQRPLATHLLVKLTFKMKSYWILWPKITFNQTLAIHVNNLKPQKCKTLQTIYFSALPVSRHGRVILTSQWVQERIMQIRRLYQELSRSSARSTIRGEEKYVMFYDFIVYLRKHRRGSCQLMLILQEWNSGASSLAISVFVCLFACQAKNLTITFEP